MEGLTHYDVLDVAKDADAETIRKAYRKVRRVVVDDNISSDIY